jgi:ribosome-associated heat shock protein Hsp15
MTHPKASPEEGDEETLLTDGPKKPDPTVVRIDKWLWAARLYKTRGLAQEAIEGGHVKINGLAVKPAKTVQIGDAIVATTPGGPRILTVARLLDQRGPAAVAATLFVDHTPPPPPKELEASIERVKGKPDRRDRAAARRLRGW